MAIDATTGESNSLKPGMHYPLRSPLRISAASSRRRYALDSIEAPWKAESMGPADPGLLNMLTAVKPALAHEAVGIK